MTSKYPFPNLSGAGAPDVTKSLILCKRQFFKFGYSARNSKVYRLRFKLVGQSPKDKWKLGHIDPNAVQERLNSWMSNAQKFLNVLTLPLVESGQIGKSDPEKMIDAQELEEIFTIDQTIGSSTKNGILSLPAIVSIEQFSR
uniref:Uncharacterized protein MANES_07G014700 n=1 Tax=Rhizophora mucronata TaxID=61149 RepID=A0A2P2LJ37_RHIMU